MKLTSLRTFHLASLALVGSLMPLSQSASAAVIVDNVGLSNSTFSASVSGALINQVQKTAGLTYNLSNNILDTAGTVSGAGTSSTYFNNALDGYIGADDAFPFLSNDSTYNTVFDDTPRSFDYLTINLSSATTITLAGAYQSAYNRPFAAMRISLYSVLNPTPGQEADRITFADIGSGADLAMGATSNAWRLFGTNFGSPSGVAGVQSIQFAFTRFDSFGVRVGDVMAIPEPTTFTLLGGSMLALAAFRRRRQ